MKPFPTKTIESPEMITADRYTLGDAIRRAFLKYGHDSWCSIADDVIQELSPFYENPSP
jgi:hypothetical protein